MVFGLFASAPPIPAVGTLPAPDAAVAMARRVVDAAASGSGTSLDEAVDMVSESIDLGVVAFAFPAAIPFMIGAAAIAVPVSWVAGRLRMADFPMPEEWYPLVLATASRDGRFLVGRLLSAEGRVTASEAIKFLAVEKSAPPRTDVSVVVSPADARAALAAYYEAERTIFDKAVTLAAGSAVGAVAAVGSFAGAALSVGMRKIRVGF